MTNHFIGINRGLGGGKFSDYTSGTSSTASLDVEVRIADVDAQSKVMTRKDVVISLQNIINAILDGRVITTFPPL